MTSAYERGRLQGKRDVLVALLKRSDRATPDNLAFVSGCSDHDDLDHWIECATVTRRRLPKQRHTETWELTIGQHSIRIEVGEYAPRGERGAPGEVWITMHKEGAPTRVAMHAFAIGVSFQLQYNVALGTIVHAYLHLAGDPSGDVCGHDVIKAATSIPDLVARLLGVEYLGMKELAVPNTERRL